MQEGVRYKKMTNHLGSLFSRQRTSLAFTQEYVSNQLQLMGFAIDRSTYTKIENGQRNVYVSEFFAIVMILDFDLPSITKYLTSIVKGGYPYGWNSI